MSLQADHPTTRSTAPLERLAAHITRSPLPETSCSNDATYFFSTNDSIFSPSRNFKLGKLQEKGLI